MKIVRSGEWLYDGTVQMPVDVVALEFDWHFELCRADDDEVACGQPQPLGSDGFLYYVRFQRAGEESAPTWVDSAGHVTIDAAVATAEASVPSPISWGGA